MHSSCFHGKRKCQDNRENTAFSEEPGDLSTKGEEKVVHPELTLPQSSAQATSDAVSITMSGCST